MPLTARQIAFDAAVKARADFLYRGIADLDQLRGEDSTLGITIDQMILMRDSLNDALALEGQHIIGDAPHAPLYFDYVDSDVSNAYAFKDDDHSFIGVTIPRFFDALGLASQLAAADEVVMRMGLGKDTDRDKLRTLLLWMLIGHVVSHEYSHHTHGHHVEKSSGGSIGRLRQQALELDADGWATYLLLNQWVLTSGRELLVARLALKDATVDEQDRAAFACVIASHAAFIFVSAPMPLDKTKVYWQTHPLQPVRLKIISSHALKFAGEFRPAVKTALTDDWYISLMDAISRLIWDSPQHAETWNEHTEFLSTAEGTAYHDALLTELDSFRETLRQWEAEAEAGAPSESKS